MDINSGKDKIIFANAMNNFGNTMRAATLSLNPALDRSMFFKSFAVGNLNRASGKSYLLPGSKGINVSRILRLYGEDAPTFGFSGGKNGEILEKLLCEENISYHFIKTEAETRMNIKIISANGVCTEANESGGPVTDLEKEQLIDAVDKAFGDVDYFFFGGSIPEGIDKDIYYTLTQKAKEKNVKVILDCDGEAFVKGIEASPYLVKPNLFELQLFASSKGEFCDFSSFETMAQYCIKICKSYDTRVLLTLGKDGAMYIDNKGALKVSAPKVTVKGFSGAGDTFVTVFVLSLSEGMDVGRALKRASSAAAAKVETEGLPARDRLECFIGQCNLEKIEL